MRIVIADASPFVRAGLRSALEDHGMLVVAACADAEDTYAQAVDWRPHAVLLAADLPGGAPETIERLREVLPAAEFVLLVDDADVPSMLRMVVAGAHGILLGTTDLTRLPHAVAGVLDGEAAFPRRLVRAMADELAQRRRPRRPSAGQAAALTARESEVLAARADGATVQQTAARLDIAPATVRRHTANAAGKLGLATSAEALRLVRDGAPERAPR